MPLVTATDAGVTSQPVSTNYGPATTLAGAGTVLANAAVIAARFTVVTGGDDTVGAKLPSTARPGDEYLVYNPVATSGLKIYPHSTGDINDGSANAAVTMEGKTMGRFVMLDGTTWIAQFTANA